MRPFPLVAALVTAALLTAGIVDSPEWLGHHVVIVVVASLATAFVAFNWWELWSSRDER